MAELKFSKRGVIKDSSFIYIEWLDKDRPAINEDIQELIVDLDSEVLYEGQTIEDTLPFLTFKQAETLFKALQNHFGEFTFKFMSLANAESGKPSISAEPKLSPFIIDDSYDNVMTSLMEAVIVDPDFETYDYEDINFYFTDPAKGVLKTYANSLGISRAELPYFPDRDSKDIIREDQIEKKNKAKKVVAEKTITRDWFVKLAMALAALGFFFGLIGIIFGMNAKSKIDQIERQSLYLYTQLNDEKTENDLAKETDVFARHFLANYFSGNKKAMTPYLSSGNARYTQPDKAEAVVSSLLEKTSLKNNNTINLTYVLSLKDEGGVIRNIRLSFDVKRDKGSDFGFIVISEPIEEVYGKPAKTNEDK